MNIVLHDVIYHFLDYSARGEEYASQIVELLKSFAICVLKL